MSALVDPRLLDEIKDYGVVEIDACFNCGNCTAACTLTSENDNFPRKIIRYAQLGLKDKLVGSKELWLCYNCGECSETCPRQVEPAAFMMAARNYAISNFDFIGLGRLLSSKPVLGTILLIVMNFVFFMFLYTNRGDMHTEELKLFEFLPYEFIHTFGLAAMVFVGLAGLVVVVNMVVQVSKSANLKATNFLVLASKEWWQALWEAVGVQALGQKSYRDNCANLPDAPPWYLKKWFIHAAAFWGFLGLLLATILDYVLDIVNIKETGAFMPIFHPIRLLGTLAGLLMVYGVSVLMARRIVKPDKAHSNSTFSDWAFLVLLWVSGVTGFAVEISLYLPQAMWGYWLLLVHVAFSIELILLLPFSKFAHAILRTTALFIHAFSPIAESKLAETEAAAD
ncbi:MAG: 4Fe-4S dicluster domain-containing protein [Chloroflexota bacterium]